VQAALVPSAMAAKARIRSMVTFGRSKDSDKEIVLPRLAAENLLENFDLVLRFYAT
jgi:hypothetical protein